MNSERDGGGIKSKKMIRRELPLVNFFTKPEEGIRKVPGKEEVMKVLNEGVYESYTGPKKVMEKN